MIIWLYNLARGWDLAGYARTRYRMMGVEIPWVPGLPPQTLAAIKAEGILRHCGVEEEEILQMLAEAREMLGREANDA